MADAAVETPKATEGGETPKATEGEAAAGETVAVAATTPTTTLAAPRVAAGAVAKEGDFVILWGSYAQINGVKLAAGAITNNRYGNFYHDDLIGQPFGSKVRPRKGGGWLALLKASPEFITQSVMHRTQIIYHADISLILMVLDAQPGKIFCEAGTGSGSCSASIARALCPGGKLYTFEFHKERQRQAQEDFERYGIQDMIVSQHGDVCMDGFGKDLDNRVDGIFLDVPMPWLAIPHADRCLVEGGRICTFSPCIEQIEKTAAELRRDGRYEGVRMFESLAVNWGVKEKEDAPAKKKRKGADGAQAEPEVPVETKSWLSYQMPMRSHTSYLLVATRAFS